MARLFRLLLDSDYELSESGPGATLDQLKKPRLHPEIDRS